jgi:hypothetical protein
VADWASFEGFAAGEHAARYAAGERTEGGALRIAPGANVKYALPQLLTLGAAGVEWSFRVVRPLRNVQVVVRGTVSDKVYARKKYGRLLPSELQKIRVKQAVKEDLEVSCHE